MKGKIIGLWDSRTKSITNEHEKYILSDAEVLRIENILKCFIKIEKLQLTKFVVNLLEDQNTESGLVNAYMTFHASIIGEEQDPNIIDVVLNVDNIRVSNRITLISSKEEYLIRRNIVINGIVFAILKDLVLELTKNSSVESSHKEIINSCPEKMNKLFYEDFYPQKQEMKINKQGRKLRKFEKKT